MIRRRHDKMNHVWKSSKLHTRLTENETIHSQCVLHNGVRVGDLDADVRGVTTPERSKQMMTK